MSDLSQQDVDAAIRRVDEMITRIGDETTGTINEQQDGVLFTGRQAQHGTVPYQVFGTTEDAFLQIQASFNAVSELAQHRAIAASPGTQQVQVTERHQQRAAEVLEERAADLDQSEIEAELARRTSRNDVGSRVERHEDFVAAFTVNTKLFIYDADVGAGEFHDAVQAIANARYRGQTYLAHEYDLAAAVDDGTDPRGFA